MVFQPAIETKGCPLLLETNTQLRCLKEGKLQLPSLDVMDQQRLQQFSTCKVRKQQTYVHIYIYVYCIYPNHVIYGYKTNPVNILMQ